MTKIKICGITTVEEVEFLNRLCPDYIGLVFGESKRKVSRERALEIIKVLRKEIKVVGVFKGNSLEEIRELSRELPLEIVQLHGYLEDFISGVENWRGINILGAINILDREKGISKYVLDGERSGEGKNWDLSLLKGREIPKEFFIAGGIGCHNVESVIKATSPYGVDVSTLVEKMEKGILRKSEKLVEEFIRKVRMYDEGKV